MGHGRAEEGITRYQGRYNMLEIQNIYVKSLDHNPDGLVQDCSN